MSNPEWFMRTTPGHRAVVKAGGTLWLGKCTCGWVTEPCTGGRAMAKAARHVQIAKTVRESDEAAKTKRLDPIKAARYESLGRAQALIGRCSHCGDHTWDGKCGTCTRLNQREARRLEQLEDSK